MLTLPKVGRTGPVRRDKTPRSWRASLRKATDRRTGPVRPTTYLISEP